MPSMDPAISRRIHILPILAGMLLVLATTTRTAWAQATYTWTVPGGGSWPVAANWSPPRTTPASNDILRIDGNVTPSPTIFSIISQQIGQLVVLNGASVHLQANPPNPVTLTITGGTGTDFDVQSGTVFLQGTPTLTISLNAAATGLVAGNVTVTNAAHRLISSAPSGLVFSGGSVVTATSGFVGNLFGAGLNNSVLFQNGSTYVCGAGNDPFAKSPPSSVVVFAAGSLYRHTQPTVAPSLVGRTYGDYELNAPGHNTITSGALPFVVDRLTMFAGQFHLRMTEMHVRGEVYVAAPATLAFDPVSPAALHFDGSAPQTINSDGTLTFNANTAVMFANPAGMTLQSAVGFQGLSNVVGGSLLAVRATVTNGGSFNVNGVFQIESGGTSAGAPFVYGPNSTLVFNNGGPLTYLGEGYWQSPTPPPNVTLQNAGGVLLQAPSPHITGTLTLTEGILTGGFAPIVIDPGGTVAGANANSFVNGKLVKTVPVSGSPQTVNMEIGGGAVYSPVSLTFPSVTVSGFLECFTNGGDHVNIETSGIDPTQSVNRHWEIHSGSMQFAPCTATFHFNALEVDAGADPASFIVRKFDAPNVWTAPATGTRTATSTEATGIASFSEFQIGEPVPPPFTDIAAGLPDAAGSSAWGDYDNDGDLDVLLTGHTASASVSRVYRNDAGTFVDLAAGLPGISNGTAAWGDYDNDGDLDVLLSGDASGGRLTRVYRNDAGVFLSVSSGLPDLSSSAAAWGDYDNDGDLDVLLAGGIAGSFISRVYRNESGTFADLGAGLPGVSYGSVAWGDYDNDGDLDILLSGGTLPSLTNISRIFRNDAGIFVDASAGVVDVREGQAAWGDYDNDGDLDILLTGNNTGNDHVARVYRNDSGAFVDISAGLPGVIGSSAAWGDYDNDGDFDILLTGDSGAGIIARIYRNDSGTFAPVDAGLQGVYYGAAAWGDYDNDGDLDILLNGATGSGRISRIYRNDNGAAPNTPPDAPSGLSAQFSGNAVTFSWIGAGDAQTPLSGLTYNLRVGTTPGGSEISSAMADVGNGYRRVPQLGNANHRLSWTLMLPPAAQYYWSVQAVDAAFAGSAFAPEQVLTPAPFVDLGAGLPGVRASSVAWGDYDNDADLDLLLIGDDGLNTISRIYRNDAGTFVDANSGLAGVELGGCAWGDYDHDGDLDIVLAGDTTHGNAVPDTRIYRNDAGVFNDLSAGLPGLRGSSVAWGDYDNDGDLDLLLTGVPAFGTFQSLVYRNDPGGFVDAGAQLVQVASGSTAWGDFDNDGDLDILLTGLSYQGPAVTMVYRNDSGTFTDIGAGLPGVSTGSAAWGDFDNDGDLDIVLAGYGASGPMSEVYGNDAGTFAPIGANLPGVQTSSVAWGDYDNDGDLDILIAGSVLARVYRNTSGTFADSGAGLPGVSYCSVAWGDVDNDGDLDLAMAGQSTSGALTQIYRNATTTPNAPPAAPSGLSAQIGGSAGIFSWNAATDAQTPAAGLSYNLRIGTTPGGTEIASAMSDLGDGYRRVPRLGNANHRLSWTVTLPPAPQYYWSVQAIDGAFAGSAFASEETAILPLFTGLSAGLPDLDNSAVAWGDYDGDGDLDLVLTGHDGAGGVAGIYRNDGATYTDIAAGLPGVWAGSVAWGDYDNDGDLDLVMTGITGVALLSRVYRNDAGTFVDIAAGLPGAYTSSSTWGDYDNDGDLDLLLTGSGPSGRFSRIYRNDAGSFVIQTHGLANLDYSTAAWADYDLDGDLDILLTGYTGGPPVTVIYRNDGGVFVDIVAGLPNVFEGAVAWGDYDSDGDPDILLTGYNGSAGVSVVYRNDAGTFVDIGAGLHGVSGGDAAWGDYDNDGDPDILLSGRDPSVGNLTLVYRNDAGSFVDIGAGVTGVTASCVAWGDCDNDGDLDLVVAGNVGIGTRITRIYTNHTPMPNTVPAAPTGLSAERVASVATFSWNVSTDTQTPASGLTYNLRVGTTPGGSEIVSAMSDAVDGYRRVVQFGNTGHRLSWNIAVPAAGPIYWGVQAVDAAFAGSPWANRIVGDCAPVPAALVAWWKLDGNGNDVTGAHAADVVGPGGYYAAGEVAQGFHPEIGTILAVPNAPELNPTALTIDAWVKLDELPPGIPVIVWKGEAGGLVYTSPYELAIYGSSMGALAGRATGLVANSGEFYEAVANVPFPVGEWVHLALTADGSMVRLYQNGQLVGSQAQTLAIGPSNYPLQIGGTTALTDGNHFPGTIDELELHAAAASAEQIEAIYNAGSQGKCGTPVEVTASPVQRPWLLRVTSNPSRGHFDLAFMMPRPEPVQLDVFDAAGRHVRTLATGSHPAGAFRIPWDGRTRSGARAPAGVYFARLRIAGQVSTTRLVLLR